MVVLRLVFRFGFSFCNDRRKSNREKLIGPKREKSKNQKPKTLNGLAFKHRHFEWKEESIFSPIDGIRSILLLTI